MIALTTLATAIQDGLNANSVGLTYKIFTDAHEYEEALITRTEKKNITNGLLTIGTSTVFPTQGILVATQGATLEICVKLPNPATDEQIITAHRAVLNAYFENYNVQEIKENGKSYTVAATYGLADTGDVAQRPKISTSIVFAVNINYGYVENGLNSDAMKFTLNGYAIPYTQATINKNPTAEANTSSNNDGRSTTRNTGYIHSFDFEMPLLTDSPLSALLLSEITGNFLNYPNELKVDINGNETTYDVIFGASSLSVQGISNGTVKFSLVERAVYAEVEDGNV